MKICAAYIRVSHHQPESATKPAPQSESKPRQRDFIGAWARKLGFPELVWFEDDESGTLTDRPGLVELIADLERCTGGDLFVEESSRLARNQALFHEAMWLCWQHRVTVWDYTKQRAIDWLSQADKESLGIEAALNEHQIHELRRRVKQAKARLSAQGCWMVPWPYGYRRGPDKHLESWPGKGGWEVVCRVWREAWNDGFRVIASRLEVDRQAGRVPGWGRDRTQPWTFQAVRQILNNPVYTGSVVFNRSRWTRKGRLWLPRSDWRIVPNAHPAVVSWEEFDRLQALLKSRITCRGIPFHPGHPHPYAGLLICGHHERRLSIRRIGGQLRLYCPMLWCPNSGTPLAVVERAIQDHPEWQARAGTEAQAAMAATLERLRAGVATGCQRVEDLRRRLDSLQHTQRRLVRQFGTRALTKDAFERALAREEEAVARMTTELADAERSQADLETALSREEGRAKVWGKLTTPLAELPDAQKRQILRHCLQQVSLIARTQVTLVWSRGPDPGTGMSSRERRKARKAKKELLP